jgi:hypothetical protein
MSNPVAAKRRAHMAAVEKSGAAAVGRAIAAALRQDGRAPAEAMG